MDETTATNATPTGEVESNDLSLCTASGATEITLRLRLWTSTNELSDADVADMTQSAEAIGARLRIDHDGSTVVLERRIPNGEPSALRAAALPFTKAVADDFLAYGPLDKEIFPNHSYHVIDGGTGIEMHYDT